MRYEGQIYRPFSEANSYLLQCTIGCVHNRCTFCGMYKDRRYRIRSLSDIKADIDFLISILYFKVQVPFSVPPRESILRLLF